MPEKTYRPRDLNSSFSSSVRTAISVDELSTSATPLTRPSSPLDSYDSILSNLSKTPRDSLNEVCSPSSDINVSIIEDFEDADYDINEPINGNVFISPENFDDTLNSPLDFPVSSPATTSSLQYSSVPTSEILPIFSHNNFPADIFLPFSSMARPDFLMENPATEQQEQTSSYPKPLPFTICPMPNTVSCVSEENKMCPEREFASSPLISNTNTSSQSPRGSTRRTKQKNEHASLPLIKNVPLPSTKTYLETTSASNIPLWLPSQRDMSSNYILTSQPKSVLHTALSLGEMGILRVMVIRKGFSTPYFH